MFEYFFLEEEIERDLPKSPRNKGKMQFIRKKVTQKIRFLGWNGGIGWKFCLKCLKAHTTRLEWCNEVVKTKVLPAQYDCNIQV